MGFNDRARDWEIASAGGASAAIGLAAGTKIFAFRSRAANTSFPVMFVGLGLGAGATLPALPPGFDLGVPSLRYSPLMVHRAFAGDELHGAPGTKLSLGIGGSALGGASAMHMECFNISGLNMGLNVVAGPIGLWWLGERLFSCKMGGSSETEWGAGGTIMHGTFVTIPSNGVRQTRYYPGVA